MNRQQVMKAIKSSPFAKAADQLAASLQPAIRITPKQTSQKKLPIGASRFGGIPDLPEGFQWPHYRGTPLTCLAQIHLSDVAQFDTEKVLPETGWLYFFYEDIEQPWGYEPEEEGSFRVVYIDETEPLVRAAPPEKRNGNGDTYTYPVCRLHFSHEMQLPDWDDGPFEDFNLKDILEKETEDAWDKYLEFFTEVHGHGFAGMDDGDPHHHLIGYPQAIQTEMRQSCQAVTHGIHEIDEIDEEETASENPHLQPLQAGAQDWILLLQIDSDDNRQEGPGWMWGDVGRLYFWIRKQDLRARNFDAVWMFLQCG